MSFRFDNDRIICSNQVNVCANELCHVYGFIIARIKTVIIIIIIISGAVQCMYFFESKKSANCHCPVLIKDKKTVYNSS